MEIKYFLDPVCGYGNSSEVYIKNRLPEIINEFRSKEEAIKYICEKEIYMFNYKNLVDSVEAKNMFNKYGVSNAHVYHINWDEKNINDYFNLIVEKLKEENYKNIDNTGMPKFDYIVQNPPYKRSLHLDFFELGLNMLSKTGKMVIIEPSTWLIKLNKTTRTKKFDLLKNKLNGHVKSVKIENLNNEFKIGLFMPLSITTIDMSKQYNTIYFNCCGDCKIVKSLYDCNLIGDYELIQSILNKCVNYGNMMSDNLFNKSINMKNKWFIKLPEIVGGSGSSFCASFNTYRTKQNITKENCIHFFNSEVIFRNALSTSFMKPYIHVLYANDANVQNTIPERKNMGNKYIPGSQAQCIYGSENEMNNWKYFVFNNKLPLFISFCLTIDQHNNVLKHVPFLVDKKRTDKEIYDLLGFNNEEIELIESTIKKFERHSPWFGRYICGKVFDNE